MIEEPKPTMTDCLNAVKKINEGTECSDEKIQHNARWLYMLNRLDFWNDMPVMLDIIKQEVSKKIKNTAEESQQDSNIHEKSVYLVRSENGIIYDCFSSLEVAREFIGESSLNVSKIDVNSTFEKKYVGFH